MKKRFLTCLLALAVMLCLLVPVLSISASAAENEEPYEWLLSKDRSSIIRSDGKLYEYISLGDDFYFDVNAEYEFINDVRLGDIYSYAPDGDVIWIEDDYELYVYATEKGYEQIKAFAEGKYESYLIELGDGTYRSAQIDKAAIESMNALGVSTVAEVKEVDVDILEDCTYHSIIARDANEILSKVTGLVFEFGDGYYYVNFAALDNSYFDAYGNFSFRSGSVPLVRLSGMEEATVIGAIENAEYRYIRTEYEIDRAAAESAFWVMFVLAGFIIPIPVLFMGMYLANSAKRGAPKYWYSLSILAAAWLVLCIVLMLMMI